MSAPATVTGERADLLASLSGVRHFLRFTVRELDDEQARRRTTVSELCLGGIVKHVTAVERTWARFMVEGADAFPPMGPEAFESHARGFRMEEGDTVAALLADYEEAAAATDELVRTLADLDASHPLPERPWHEPGASWSVRRTVLHLVAETAQHAGHADIIREAIDGQKTMG